MEFSSSPNCFMKPVKKINEGQDVPQFLSTHAYRDIGLFVMQLNRAMCPRKASDSDGTITWQLDSSIILSEPVQKLQDLLECIASIIDEVPPDTGPQRFGNISFRKWHEILESRVRDLLTTHLPESVLNFKTSGDCVSVLDELTPYLMGGFGSSQRLDYGTGHELSFLAFLGCIWKLGGFITDGSSPNDGDVERSIVIGVVEPYLRVIRRLILTYTLEPAGSHGVWGLDDHAFLPYIFGSAQYCPTIGKDDDMPIEGSLPSAPKPGEVVKKAVVDRERNHNMYFAAIGFIYDVKTGPFWEHSPMLFDISGIRAGWGKINKGMIKMYNAEVLSKFPVVQHFPFGSLFSWDQDVCNVQFGHTPNQPRSHSFASNAPTASRLQQETTRNPWSSHPASVPPATSVPYVSVKPQLGNEQAVRASETTISPGQSSRYSRTANLPRPSNWPDVATRAPWATDKGPGGG